jgi:uncharacterized phage protein gp47/JayE
MNYHDLILGILERIGYSDDKEKFIDKFLSTIQLETLFYLNGTLSPEKQSEFDETLSKAENDPNKAAQVVKEYFTQDQIQKASLNTAIKEIDGLLDSVKDTLTSSQKQQVTDFVAQASTHIISR